MIDWLVDMRRAKGLTLKACAVEIGISKSTLSHLECGEPSRQSTMQKVADYFGFDVARLGEPAPPPMLKRNPAQKSIYDAGLCADELRIIGRLGRIKDFRELFTVYEDGTTSGSYWDALERVEHRR